MADPFPPAFIRQPTHLNVTVLAQIKTVCERAAEVEGETVMQSEVQAPCPSHDNLLNQQPFFLKIFCPTVQKIKGKA